MTDIKEINAEAHVSEPPARPVVNMQQVGESYTPIPISSPLSASFFDITHLFSSPVPADPPLTQFFVHYIQEACHLLDSDEESI